jgi:nucleoside-diphosphate-sugar epimerase
MNTEQHIILGTGPLGQSVMRELALRGKPVKMVNFSGKRPADIPDSIEIVASDLYSPVNVRALAQGAAAVYLCAQPAYSQWPEKWPPLMKSIIEGMTATNTKLVLGDNLYCYGDTHGQPIREDLPYQYNHTRKGKVRAEIAEMLMTAHQTGKLRAAIGRGSTFYGPAVLDSTTGERAIAPALEGKAASLIGNIDLPHTLTFINDFGRALVILGERDEALGQVWHVPNAATPSQREWMTMIFEELGKPPKMSGMGKIMMSIGGLFIPEAREMIEMMYEFDQPHVVDHSKFTRAFGDHSTPQREAVKQTVAWYKAWAERKAGVGQSSLAVA